MNGPSTNWGHPVAYHPMLSRFFGSVNAAIFFGQLRYWSDKTENPLGVYKTSEEWTEETGLSYREQVTARRILSAPGYVVETNKRLDHRIYFLIDWTVFNAAFEAWEACNSRTTFPQFGNCVKRTPPNDVSAVREVPKRRSSISTETTSETTAGEGSAKALEIPLPLFLDYQKIREAKNAGPLTQTAIDGLKADAKLAGITVEQAVTACVKHSWASFVPAWYAERTGAAPSAPAAPAKGKGKAQPGEANYVPPVSDVWHESKAGVTAMAAQLGIKPRDEVMETAPAFKARVMAAFKKKG